MATYAIGDIHGCLETLRRLLDRIDWDPERDRLWLVGDLVNGGPDSLGVLRWVRERSDRTVTVLGNHDLHLLAVAAGEAPNRPEDTFGRLLEAPDADRLLNWLRRRPMLHSSGDTVLVHAGLLPEWTADEAGRLAGELEEALRERDPSELFAEMYGNHPRGWSGELEGIDRLRVVVNALTRMRTLEEGRMDFDFKGEPQNAPGHLEPWYSAEPRRWGGRRVVCGHWSAAGYRRSGDVHLLDSGCRWGGELTALRLDDEKLFQVESELSDGLDA